MMGSKLSVFIGITQAKYPGKYATAVNVANGIWSFITPMQEQVSD